jgi:NTE family protein
MSRPAGSVLLLVVLTLGTVACAAPVQRLTTTPVAPASVTQSPVVRTTPAGRPLVGVAFGGGSARGIAHVGVIRWFEEHRIPVDLAAGTSMGGLIGGSFATGMDAAAIEAMLEDLNWDELFGASSFPFKNIRRKADARSYPSRLEFGLRGGIVPPTSINNGQQVDLLISRITAPYHGISSFDELPTPFRAVAVDLVSARQVVLESGPLASAMRATMSLPLIFPPVELDGRVLVDGGAMDNVPADVVRRMGAGRVVAVNVGDLSDREALSFTMLGLAGATLDAMMRASTLRAIADADVVINVPLAAFGSLDWRRGAELIAEGYKAAEAMRDRLLPLALSEAEYAEWADARQKRRRHELPVPAFVTSEGFAANDERRLTELLAKHVGVPFNSEALEYDLAELSGIDRYETIGWRFVTNAAGDHGLLIRARPKPYAPPFMMLGLNLENTTSDDFRISLTARYLGFDLIGSGSEVRIDGTLGSDPGLGAELYRPLWSTPFFVAPYAAIVNETFNVIRDDAVVARYGQTFTRGGVNLGVNLGRLSDVRLGAYLGHLDASVQVGEPGLPAISGREAVAELNWRFDGQDSYVIPSRGVLATTHMRYFFDGPEVTIGEGEPYSSEKLLQLSGEANRFSSFGERNRVFVLGGLGTSFDRTPLPTNQFILGSPLHLGAYNVGEIRGNHYFILTGGYLRQLGRLPDFIGGPVYAGGWLENGDAFDEWASATVRTHASLGVIMDTLIGPVLVGGSAGFDGRWRTYIGVGRLFRR